MTDPSARTRVGSGERGSAEPHAESQADLIGNLGTSSGSIAPFISTTGPIV
jgi:hypothetical protein